MEGGGGGISPVAPCIRACLIGKRVGVEWRQSYRSLDLNESTDTDGQKQSYTMC